MTSEESGGLWIGANNFNHEGGFAWATYPPKWFKDTNWQSWKEGEPKNTTGKEHCVMTFTGEGLWKWTAELCDEKHDFVCQNF